MRLFWWIHLLCTIGIRVIIGIWHERRKCTSSLSQICSSPHQFLTCNPWLPLRQGISFVIIGIVNVVSEMDRLYEYAPKNRPRSIHPLTKGSGRGVNAFCSVQCSIPICPSVFFASPLIVSSAGRSSIAMNNAASQTPFPYPMLVRWHPLTRGKTFMLYSTIERPVWMYVRTTNVSMRKKWFNSLPPLF